MAFLAKSIIKITTWILRLFQNVFALILIGVCGYMLHQFNQFHFLNPQEVVVPMLFSCIALVVSFFSLIAICCLPYTLQILAAFFDFAILSGFITSAVLLANNFHADDKLNPLRNWLIYIRLVNHQSDRHRRSSALVKLLDACVILMIILFFFTTLLSVCLAMLSTEEHYERAATREMVEVEEGHRHGHGHGHDRYYSSTSNHEA